MAAPTATVTAVSPDPRNIPIEKITIVFSEAVTNFNLADLSLKRGGGANLLTSAQVLATANNTTFVLHNLAGITEIPGTYVLLITAADSAIENAAHELMAVNASDQFVVGYTRVGTELTANFRLVGGWQGYIADAPPVARIELWRSDPTGEDILVELTGTSTRTVIPTTTAVIQPLERYMSAVEPYPVIADSHISVGSQFVAKSSGEMTIVPGTLDDTTIGKTFVTR